MDQRIGAQLFSVRDFCKTAEEFEQTMQKLQKIGYKVVQLSGINWEIPANTIKELCDKYGMTVACTHMPMDFYEEKMDWVIDYHKTAGAKVAGIGGIWGECRENLENLRATIQKMNGFDKELKEAGLRFGYHNHMFEFIKYEGKHMYDYLIGKEI